MIERNFGTGDAGAKARAYLETEPPCRECGEPGAELTLDYELYGLSQVPLHERCLKPAKARITNEFAMSRREPSFGINGLNRA